MKLKAIPYSLIPDDHEAYGMLRSIVSRHHPHLADASIALAWHEGWNEDPDGRVKLGVCRKVSDLDRDLHDHDFVIILNRSFWVEFSAKQQAALLDHELMHAAVKVDKTNRPQRDDRGRIVYRIRKHDVEEFSDIVKRHGIWKGDLENFVKSLAEKQPDLFNVEKVDRIGVDVIDMGGTVGHMMPETARRGL